MIIKDFIPKPYLEILSNRNFLILALTNLFTQLATAFLVLTLIVSAFLLTKNNFAVSGVVISLAMPAFLLMALAGVIADIFDRKKVILGAILYIAFVVFLILTSISSIAALISLAFFYNAGSSFLIPAISAGTGQLVVRSKLQIANSIFVFTLAGGQVLGLFLASVIHFFFGNQITLLVAQALLLLSLWLAWMLPSLKPVRKPELAGSIIKTLKDIGRAFLFIFSQKIIWIFFIILAFMQALVAFGATLGPGFFDEVIGLSINKSPIFVLPLIGLGVVAGSVFSHNQKIKEGFLVKTGFETIGLSAFVLGVILRFSLFKNVLLLLPVAVFLVSIGFGVVVCVIAARTVLQKKIAHSYQGTVFGATIVLSAFLASIFSIIGATTEAIWGYVAILIFVGLLFSFSSFVFEYFSKKWKF